MGNDEEARIAKMADEVVSTERVAASPDDDEALANVDQALDAMVAAVAVLDDNLPKLKVDGVPQQAARDAVADLVETAIKPYLADILKAMQVFGGE